MNRARLTQRIKRDENEPLFRSKGRSFVHDDSLQIPTLGYGRNLRDVGISEKEATHLLTNDIEDAVADARAIFPSFDDLSDVRQEVLVNMTLNVGATRLMRFSKMRAAIAERKFERAADEMLDSRWADQVGARATRLANEMRRGE